MPWSAMPFLTSDLRPLARALRFRLLSGGRRGSRGRLLRRGWRARATSGLVHLDAVAFDDHLGVFVTPAGEDIEFLHQVGELLLQLFRLCHKGLPSFDVFLELLATFG